MKLAAVLALLVLGCSEFLAFVAGKILARQGLVYAPPPLDGFDAYLADRDPLLGWPGLSSFGKGERDTSGSRVVPAFPDPATKSCVTLFGDSFTWGDEVTPENAYGNVLAKGLGCRVANFGVGGYGTDQAVLRYEAIRPNAPYVVLGHQSDNIIRNVNQDRGFLTNVNFGLKPRFVLADGQLQLVPIPVLDEETYRHLTQHAGSLFPLDPFRPGGSAGVVALRFPFTISALRALGHYRLRARFHKQPSYAPFYAPNHPSGALDVTVAIIERFVATARARGQTPLVVLIPDIKDLQAILEQRSPSYQPLVDRMSKLALPFVSSAEPLAANLRGRPACDLYFSCSGSHFRPEGYRELADVVARALEQRGFTRPGL